MYNLQLQRGKVFFLFFWHDSTRRVDVKREVQNKHVMFLPFWFYILQYIWWINNKTQVSSFRLWTRCSLGVSTPVRWQTDCGLQTQTGRPTQCFLSEHRDKANWCFWDALWIFFFCVCVYFGRKNVSFVAETLLQTFVSLMRMTFWRLRKWTESFFCNVESLRTASWPFSFSDCPQEWSDTL